MKKVFLRIHLVFVYQTSFMMLFLRLLVWTIVLGGTIIPDFPFEKKEESTLLVNAEAFSSSSSSSLSIFRWEMPSMSSMLFPQNILKEKFGTDPLATMFFTTTNEETNQQQQQPQHQQMQMQMPSPWNNHECPNQLLCLHVVLTSEYELDPFVLQKYESTYPIGSFSF